MDPRSIADSLNQLTSGWTPAPGVTSQALNAARVALASSLIAGKSLPDIYAIQSPVSAQPPEDPKLVTDLLNLAQVASTATTSTIAYVRSARAASINNPSGVPDWARYAGVVQSLGPFLDPAGVVHWVNLVPMTASAQLAFGGSSTFGVFPIEYIGAEPASATTFDLGPGSVWFLANLLSSAFPAGAFTGFEITGGTLSSSTAMTLTSGVYVIPDAATVTLTAILAPKPAVASSGIPGADAAAATFTPPASVTMIFTHTGAGFSAVGVASTWVYSCETQLIWGGDAAVPVANQPTILIPCASVPSAFVFTTVESEIFTPSGTAPVASCGWALPLVAATITTLPEAGVGAGRIVLGAGASLQTSIQSSVAIAGWQLEVSTGGLFIVAGGVEPLTQINETIYQLWPLAVNPKLNATVSYWTSPSSSTPMSQPPTTNRS